MIKSNTALAPLVRFVIFTTVIFSVIAVDMHSSNDEPQPESAGELEPQYDVEQILRHSDIFHMPEMTRGTENRGKIDGLTDVEDEVAAPQKLEAQKEADKETAEGAAAQQAAEETARKAAEEATRQPAVVPTHEGCRGSLIVSGIRSTKYFDAYEGDYNNWIEFYNAVRLEGTGVGLNGRYYRYDSITTDKTTSPSHTREQLGGSIAGGDGWPYVRHTMAADLAVNPLGTQYYLDWGEGNPWNGIYVVEDTGGGLHGWHLDIYTGFGKSAMLAPVGQYVNVYTANC